jgi:hypothetical protein
LLTLFSASPSSPPSPFPEQATKSLELAGLATSAFIVYQVLFQVSSHSLEVTPGLVQRGSDAASSTPASALQRDALVTEIETIKEKVTTPEY